MNFFSVMESINTQSDPITESCTQSADCGESQQGPITESCTQSADCGESQQGPITESCTQSGDCLSNSLSSTRKFAAPPQSQQNRQEFQEAPSFLC